MAKWEIRYESANDIETAEWEVIDADTEEEALEYAWEMACADLESYCGLNGLPNLDTIAEENPELDEDGVWEAYCEERDVVIQYDARKAVG